LIQKFQGENAQSEVVQFSIIVKPLKDLRSTCPAIPFKGSNSFVTGLTANAIL
jgi:hypothetical protein